MKTDDTTGPFPLKSTRLGNVGGAALRSLSIATVLKLAPPSLRASFTRQNDEPSTSVTPFPINVTYTKRTTKQNENHTRPPIDDATNCRRTSPVQFLREMRLLPSVELGAVTRDGHGRLFHALKFPPLCTDTRMD